MDANVMNLVKGKRARVPRTKNLKKTSLPAKRSLVPNKRNPFRPFTELYFEEFPDEMDKFVENGSWTQSSPDYNRDRGYVRMFNILRTGMPWPLVKQFFVEFDASDSENVLKYFEYFMRKPSVESQISQMKKILEMRKAVPAPYETRSTRATLPARKPIITPDVPMISKYDHRIVLPECEREYKRAPWMVNFTSIPIKHIVLKETEHTDNYMEAFTVGQGLWRPVNALWYRAVCEHPREFVPGGLGYVTAKGDLIVETRDMYELANTDWNKFSPLDEFGIQVAKIMLEENPVMIKIFGKDLQTGVARVIDSFGTFVSTNFEMATNISRVLAVLYLYMNRPRMAKTKISKGDYSAGDTEDMDSFKTEVRERFYKLLRDNNPALRKYTRPAPVTAPSRQRVIDENNIAVPLRIPDRPSVSSEKIVPKTTEMFAPGLFQKLKNRIARLSPILCSGCKVVEIPKDSSYTTVGPNSKKLRFCGKNCFDDFDMRI
jgi:hypothetical protein